MQGTEYAILVPLSKGCQYNVQCTLKSADHTHQVSYLTGSADLLSVLGTCEFLKFYCACVWTERSVTMHAVCKAEETYILFARRDISVARSA